MVEWFVVTFVKEKDTIFCIIPAKTFLIVGEKYEKPCPLVNSSSVSPKLDRTIPKTK